MLPWRGTQRTGIDQRGDALERELDIRLFARSTRSLRLTAQGEEYLPYAKQVLATLQEGRERLRGEADALQGSL